MKRVLRSACAITLITSCVAMAQEAPRPAKETEDAHGVAWILGNEMKWNIGETSNSVVIGQGFVHDKASVPRSLWALVPPSGRYTRPAVVHDYLYWTQQCTRLQADNLFLIAMKENGVGAFKRFLIYRGVRMGGRKAWNRNAADRQAGYTRFLETSAFDDLKPWRQIREERKGDTSREPREFDTGYCRWGDSTDVPTEQVPLKQSPVLSAGKHGEAGVDV